MKNKILIFILTLFSLTAFSQSIDTVKIYKSKTRYSKRNYFREWFYTDKSYSTLDRKTNHQDSLVMHPTKTTYFKYYTRPKGKLILEGKNSYLGSWLDGEVKFYRRNGRLDRIENWGIRERDTCGVTLSVHDAPAPKDTWKYFDSNGNVIQTITYHIDIISCKPLSYKLIKTSKHYNKQGQILKSTDELLEESSF